MTFEEVKAIYRKAVFYDNLGAQMDEEGKSYLANRYWDTANKLYHKCRNSGFTGYAL